MRWPRDAAQEALSCLESLGTHWTLPSRCPGEGSVFGVSDAAGASDDGAWRGWAYAYHSPRFMRVRSGPISPLSKDIFREELGVCVSGQIDAMGGSPVDQVTWHCDNLRSIYVIERGWSADHRANEDIVNYHEIVRLRSASSEIAYVPSALNAVDFLTRGGGPVDLVAPACDLHPGQPCPEFWSFLASAGGEHSRRPRVAWATAPTTVTFHKSQPPAAVGHLRGPP